VDRRGLGHPEAGGPLRGRGQGALALVVAGAVVAGAIALDRVEPRGRRAVEGGAAASRAWICPHGGGEGWRGTIFLANPSRQPAVAHVTSVAGGGSSSPRVVDLPPGSTIRVEVTATTREAATFVETFGPWVSAGWVVRGSGSERGTGAEPCIDGGGRAWFVSDGTTEEGEEAFVVVANPFATDAVVDVVMFAEGRPPIRDSHVTDLSVPARASIAVRLGRFAAGEPAIGTLVRARVGRVGVAALGVGASGIRSTIGWPTLVRRLILPIASGSGQATLEVFGPGEDAVALGTTLLSRGEPALIDALVEVEQEPRSAAAYSVAVDGSSALEISTQGPGAVTATLRAAGTRGDAATTAGAAAGAPAWVVLPAVDADPSTSTIVLVNPGDVAAEVGLELLPASGTAPTVTSITVPPRSVAAAAPGFLGTARAAVVVRCQAGAVVAVGAATTGVVSGEGAAGYALSMGVPLES
jgi:hypothetical protein